MHLRSQSSIHHSPSPRHGTSSQDVVQVASGDDTRPLSYQPSGPMPCESSPPMQTAPLDWMKSFALDNAITRHIIINTSALTSFCSPVCVPHPWIRNPEFHVLHFITRGHLVVSKKTEIRLRLWRAQYPDVPLWFLAIQCLTRGLDWRLFVHPNQLVSPMHGPLIPRPPHLDALSKPLVYNPALLETYECRTRALLCLPYARRFVTMGGILWRIALHYGPPSLLSAALSGPSTDSYMHYHVDHAGPHIDDTVTQADIDLLLGVTSKGSFWPTLDIWAKSQKWHGEWSVENESWFQERLRVMHSLKKEAVVKRGQWIRSTFMW
ncbi:hypothetical protein BDR03DRAFT_1019859 [Suillus americanus]|nr:hypothetical protein BDR03DRAFT_1019859 [Suillus americanus]